MPCPLGWTREGSRSGLQFCESLFRPTRVGVRRFAEFAKGLAYRFFLESQIVFQAEQFEIIRHGPKRLATDIPAGKAPIAAMDSIQRIGLYGGTFDPVHAGHLHLASRAVETLRLDKLRFIPCQISPHKIGRIPASGEDRLEMLRRATRNLTWAVVDDWELCSPGPSYSFRTAEAMQAHFPEARLFWILGADQWAALPMWKSPERLAAIVEFAVMSRDGNPVPRDGYRMHEVDGHHPASSSVIREKLSDSASEVPWLDSSVHDWIRARNLYLD